MKQTKLLSQNDSPLLNFAVSRLSPDVFLHPVWMRFGKQDASVSANIANDLLNRVKGLQDSDPGLACQILLICAVYQNYAGQAYNALKTNQQALALAERTGLSREIVWAIWGACAISIQQGKYDQAASHLVDLQAILSQQNEWILAGFVDEVKQSLLHAEVNGGKHSGTPQNDLLTLTFEWLQHWGFSYRVSEPDTIMIVGNPVGATATQSTLTQSFFSVQRWQGHWHTLMLMFKSELKLQWVKNDPRPTNTQFSFWGTIRSLLSLSQPDRSIDTQVIDDVPQIPSNAILPPVQDNPPVDTPPRKRKAASGIEKARANHLSKQEATAIPVAVHMLGAFSLTIQGLTLKLPSSRGLSLFKYLLLHHKQNTSREVLMDIFWPEAEPELARNNLNVAMHNLRKAIFNITDLPIIIYEGGAYSLAPGLQLWLDVEEFERCVKAGQRLEARNQLTAAVTEYEAAISLYQGDFLEQNPYEEWTILDRERLRITYLDTLDRLSQIYFEEERYSACRSACQLILMRDPCREDAHCLLMRCYSRQGQHHLALRQYQTCAEALHGELQVEPAPETTQLYNRIRRREQV